MPGRIIRLRRPPVLHEQGGPFVPQRVSLAEIDARWEELRLENPSLYDGPCWHVLGVHRNGHGGAAVHVMRSSYRFHAVQDQQCDTGFRGLGVSAITRRGDEMLLGRRGPHVQTYPDLWEFAPAGVLEPGVDPVQMIDRELAEEADLRAATSPAAIAMIFDLIARAWQIIYRIEIADGDEFTPSHEHSELRWCNFNDLPADLSPVDRQIASLL